MDAPWIIIARRHLGLAEIPGKDTAPTIARWLRDLRAWWTDDETPWCGTFVAACLREAEVSLPRHWYRAKAWLDWGTPIMHPVAGCIVVFERPGGGHVGFVTGRDLRDRLMVLGGNQGNRVSVAPFDPSRVLGYRWPAHLIVPSDPLPLIRSAGAASSNEA